jgi:hypothetical protein
MKFCSPDGQAVASVVICAYQSRGLARCTVLEPIDGPFAQNRGPLGLAISALGKYPMRRWLQTLPLVRRAGLWHTLLFIGLTPLVLAGYFAGGWGSWRELESLGAPSPSVQ